MVVRESQKGFDIFLVFGTWQFFTATTFSGFILIPSALMIFPRNLISFWKRLHFFVFSFQLYFLNMSSTLVKFSKWSAQFLPNTMTSSKYAIYSFQVNPSSTRCLDSQVIIWRFQQALSYLNFTWIFDASLLCVMVIVFLDSFFPVLQLDVAFLYNWFWLYTCQVYLHQ
jgi:hypothetical protein